MRPAPSPSLDDRPSDRAARAAAAAAARKARLRHLALDRLEARELLTAIPSPVKDPQLPYDKLSLDLAGAVSSNTWNDDYIGANPGHDNAPQIAVDRYNPDKLVAVWVNHDQNPGQPGAPNFYVEGAWSIDAGRSWSRLANLPQTQFDPASGNNPHVFTTVDKPTVAFDAQDNFYVLENQHADDYGSGALILKAYAFGGLAPASGATTVVHSWYQGSQSVVLHNGIESATLAVDDNQASFADPTTGVTQADPGVNNIYIAWNTDEPPPQGYTGPWNRNTIELVTSFDGGATFNTRINQFGSEGGQPADDALGGHTTPNYQAAAPRLAISQGRPAGTLSATDTGVAGGQVTVIWDDIKEGRTGAPIGDFIWSRAFQPSVSGGQRSISLGNLNSVAFTTVLGSLNGPYANAGTSKATPGDGFGPGAVIASDNTLGSYAAHQGRLYVAYVDRYDTVRYGASAAANPADNTDIFMVYSDDGGNTWFDQKDDPLYRFPLPANDDNGFADGVSGAVTSLAYITGKAQFLPELAVDPITGVLALSYDDTRYDAARARYVQSIQVSDDGAATFAPSVVADPYQVAYDQSTQKTLNLQPVPANFASAAPGTGTGGLGDRAGLAILGGRLYDAYATNVNGGDDQGTITKFEIHVTPMTYETGPRVVSSTMGTTSAQTVTTLPAEPIRQPSDPAPNPANFPKVTFNNQETADGTPVLDGFVVTFDRPIDAATFTPADVTVTYRDAFTPGSQPGIPVNVSGVTPLYDGAEAVFVKGLRYYLPTKFLVRFDPQSAIGTYSYTVGPDIRDLTRATVTTNLYYADQLATNLPTLPPTGTVSSSLTIPAPASNQVITDLKVLVSLTDPDTSKLALSLRFTPAGGGASTTVPLINRGEVGGVGLNFVDLVLDPQALLSIDQANPPRVPDPTAPTIPQSITGHYQPFTNSPGQNDLLSLLGRSPAGTWTLQISSLGAPGAGKLVSWGLQVTTGTRSADGRTQASGAAAAAQTGSLMDQDADGVGNRNPNAGGIFPSGSEVYGTAPGDVYAVPMPAPATAQVFTGAVVGPPYDGASLPLQVAGAHVVRSYVPNYTVKTADNLVTDAAVPGLDVVFDRDIDPGSIEFDPNNTTGTGGRNHVASLTTPLGTYRLGDRLPDGGTLTFRIVRDPNSDPQDPGADPNARQGFFRTYQVQFYEFKPGATVAVPYPQVLSGSYAVTLTSDIQDRLGNPIDTNQNAGLDVLRSTPSVGTATQTYQTQASVAIGPGQPGVSIISVPDTFSVQNVVVTLNIAYPDDSKLTARLVSPNGASVLLFTNVSSAGVNTGFSNTTLDDRASTPIRNGTPSYFGRFNPQEQLSALDGQSAGGNWQLVVTTSDPSKSGSILNWTLKLDRPLSDSGLGETTADRATQGFRIFTLDPTNSQSSNSWTQVGPTGEGAKVPGGNAEVAGRVDAIAVDPSDPSGNTVYVGGASGGIWKTVNFLTHDPAGPSYVPLTDDASTFALNIASITIFPRNNDTSQSIIFAATGEGDATGDPSRAALTSRGAGFLRSMDGGATWTLLDSTDNALPLAQRDHAFASNPGQAGVTSYKIVVDPHPTPNNQVIVYAALSDIDGNGNSIDAGAGTKGGLWRSLDSGQTWTRVRAGQATDVTLDLASVNANSGNLDFLYAAFRGDGVYFSPNGGQNFNLMTGQVGDPLIQSTNTRQPTPVQVRNLADTPNGKAGRIVLAKPALTGVPLTDLIQQGWLYAAVVNRVVPADQVEDAQTPPSVDLLSDTVGLYLTKDFGQTWTLVHTYVQNPSLPVAVAGDLDLPTNSAATADPTSTATAVPVTGDGTPLDHPFHLGNYDLSLAVDPNNANVVYLGGTGEFQDINYGDDAFRKQQAGGLIRVDATLLHDAHNFAIDDLGNNLAYRTAVTSGGSSVLFPNDGPPRLSSTIDPSSPPPPPYNPLNDPFLNLLRDPLNPFQNDATILVEDTGPFANDGGGATWKNYGQALAPNPFAPTVDAAGNAADSWSKPTQGVHRIVTLTDPLTGKSRLIFGTDQGVYTVVADGDGALIGALGTDLDPSTLDGGVPAGQDTNTWIPSGTRNGNLAIAQVYQGAVQASQVGAGLSVQKGFFYANTQGTGLSQSDPDIINKGTAGYGDLSSNVAANNGQPLYNVVGGTVDRGSGYGLQVQSNADVDPVTGQLRGGTVYQWRTSESTVGQDKLASARVGAFSNGRPSTDTVQVNTVGRTNLLYQQSNPTTNTPDPQWAFRPGYNLTVNPLSGDQMLTSSSAGKVFATTNQGRTWAQIGDAGDLDGSRAQALTYGAPAPVPPGQSGLGTLNNYILAGTLAGHIYVTFTGGGAPGQGNAWAGISNGLDGSAVQAIVTDPQRGSFRAYAVTSVGIYYKADTRTADPWLDVTGNLLSLTKAQLRNPALGATAAVIPGSLTTVQADWRYTIPDDFAQPSGPSHPMLYAAGQGGVFRSYDGGKTWAPFPDGGLNPDGTVNTSALLYSPLGAGGGLPNARVTDLDLSIGLIDPTTGAAQAVTNDPVTGTPVRSANVLMASTYGRGTFAIRLAPIVFPNTASNQGILHLSTTAPTPPGTSDSGFSNADAVTNVTNPVIQGTSERSVNGNVVTIDLYDFTPLVDYYNGKLGAGTPAAAAAIQGVIDSLLSGSTSLQTLLNRQAALGLPAFARKIAEGATNADGTFAVGVGQGIAPQPGEPDPAQRIYKKDGSTDGPKFILVQATNGSGTSGNFAPLGALDLHNFTAASSFTLDTVAPTAPGTPDLADASDTGLSATDNVTNLTGGLNFSVALSAGEPSTTVVYLCRDNVGNVVAQASGVGSNTAVVLTDPGPVTSGQHTYFAYEVDLAGNKGPISTTSLTVTVDTTAPAKPARPILDPTQPSPGGSDSGVVGDNITNVKNPFLAGTAEPLGHVQIIDAAGNVLAPSDLAINVAANGRYSIRSSTLADGTYSLRVREEDLAGNLSDPSDAITVQILSRTPQVPTLALVPADDTGVIGDNVTSNSRPRLTGTGNAGLSVRLYVTSDSPNVPPGVPTAGGLVAPASGQPPVIVANDGSYVIQFPQALPDGTYKVYVVTSDVAGNSSSSAVLSLRILGGGVPNPLPGGGGGGTTTPPPTPAAPSLALLPADDTGVKGDNATVARRPRLSGTARYTDGTLARNVVVELVAASNGGVIATATTNSAGAFTIGPPNDLVNGTLAVFARTRDVAGNPGPASNTVTLTITSAAGDLDGDGKADLDSFYRANSTFYLTTPNVALAKAPFLTQAGDVPLSADFDGDGKMDYGFYRPSTAQWMLAESRAGLQVVAVPGTGNDLPVPADFDGDKIADLATFNPTSGKWTVFQSGSGTLRTFNFGVPGQNDEPIPADFDGDGKADPAYWVPSSGEWFAAFSSGNVNSGNPLFHPYRPDIQVPYAVFGIAGQDVPVVGDFDGDGKADLVTYRPASAEWFGAFSTGNTATGNAGFHQFSATNATAYARFGLARVDIPVSADYDGDGKADVAVHRPTTAEYFILNSAGGSRVQPAGSTGAVPLMAPLQPYRVQAGSSSAGGTVSARAFASSGADVSTDPAGGPDLGRTAATFAATVAPTPKAAAAPAAKARPAQAEAAHPAKAAAHHTKAKAKADARHHDAALTALGFFKILRVKG